MLQHPPHRLREFGLFKLLLFLQVPLCSCTYLLQIYLHYNYILLVVSIIIKLLLLLLLFFFYFFFVVVVVVLVVVVASTVGGVLPVALVVVALAVKNRDDGERE